MAADIKTFTVLEEAPEESAIAFNGKLEVHYIPLSTAFSLIWEKNAKLHNIGDLIKGFQDNGFRDPPSYDTALDAIVEGNGRIEALQLMSEQNMKIPKNIARMKSNGEWCIPIIFGGDSESQTKAMKYAIDHNAMVLSGGDFTGADIFFRLHDTSKLVQIMDELADNDEMPIVIDQEEFDDLRRIYEKQLSGEFSEEEKPEEDDHEAAADASRGDGEKASGRIKPDSLPKALVLEIVRCHSDIHTMMGRWSKLAKQIENLAADSILDDEQEFNASKVLGYIIDDAKRLEKTLLEYSEIDAYEVK